ncbi:hypothetical protein ACFW9D_07665 [Streptomyces sp. NPDC059524]|uniref:hypothetical protein n=1 Tax=Streptomyces sp. NPDC059524 TaxID=3346856 RepID=UPI0036CAED0F
MTGTQGPAAALQDLAALWSAGDVEAYALVEGACTALVAGLDGPALRLLAAVAPGDADYDLPDLLPAALEDLGLTYHPRGSEAGRLATVGIMARRTLAGGMTPRAFVEWIHVRFGHGVPHLRSLAEYDDVYEIIEYEGLTRAELDAQVLAEARRVVEA